MSITWDIYPASELESAASEWNALCTATAAMPFLETLYLLPLLHYFGDGRERLCLGRRDGELVAGALVTPAALGRWQTFQPSQLPLGAWIQKSDEILEELLATLTRQLPGFAISVGATQIDPRFTRRPANGRQLASIDYIETAWIDVEGSFDDFWAQRGKNLRTNVRKQRAKLEDEGIQLSLDILTDAASVEAAVREFGSLEASGWKAGAGTAVQLGTPQGDFYRDMLTAFCARQRGEIWRYRFGESVVAMDFSILSGDTIVVLKTAFDATHKTVSPATLLHHDAFRALFERGTIRRIEFYGRVMEWHTRWTTQQRTLFHTTFFRWPLLLALRERVNARRTDGAAATEPTST
ncbi:hypothetical protein GCM10025771_24940 [Niveibacterium umoris]|uniref:BioF2-like acetyltransferase domain-containing protein n=1 Tax=Niveibacterium umoris TaxID=1193620 RepID=A0A840BL88_9RHOO|nr:GNAT family N-acetyltransferase [Niveibacterium umoris]MBB4012318.1 hypothetical protein [Niveibacterium umoris]